MDARTFPPDTCPLCKRRALSLEEGVLRCTNCQAEAQLDATTRQVRYTLIPKLYAQFEEALKDKWLTRRATFEATEQKPLPTVVFFPIIVSLLALCALFGLIGVVLAVRPGMGTTRQIIDEAYAKQNGITQTVTTSLTPTLTTTLEVSLTAPLSGTLEALTTMTPTTPTAASEAGLPPTPPAIAPPPAVPTQPSAPTPSIPTRLPTFTPIAPPPVVPPSPTVQLPPTAPPTQIPTITPVQNSPVPTPPITRTSTVTPTTGQPSAATPTVTITPTPTQKGYTLITGTVAITNVVYAGLANFNNDGDEYIDLFNTGATPASVANYKFRVAGQPYPLTGNLQIAPNSGCRIYTNFFPTSDPPPPYNGCGGAHSLSLSTGPTGIWPNVTGTKVELLDPTDQVVATFSY